MLRTLLKTAVGKLIIDFLSRQIPNHRLKPVNVVNVVNLNTRGQDLTRLFVTLYGAFVKYALSQK